MRILALLLSLLLVASITNAQQLSSDIPLTVKFELNRQFPNWQFAEVPQEIHRYFATLSNPSHPNFIKGDFDGNGQMDYAVYVVYGKPAKRRVGVVALLKRGGTYKSYILVSGEYVPNSRPLEADGATYLALNKKGERAFDFGAQKYFIFRRDAIFVGLFEKAGSSYIYERGRFREILTSD